jgi:hypothetical protein
MNANPIIDTLMTFEEAIAGTHAPAEIIDSLQLIEVRYWSFDERLHQGQLVVHREAVEDMREIFALIERSLFPVGRVIPIVKYGWSDDASMEDNNTSAFNYRFVLGTERLSRHACGRAIDINPRQNPVIYDDGRISPAGTVYNPGAAGSFSAGHTIVKEFLKRGWQWGGFFKSLKDYHHFDRPA